MKTIDIDIEVHKRVEADRATFEESENDILRRLLGLPKSNSYQAFQGASDGTSGSGGGAAWSSGGVSLSHGTPLEMHYGGRKIEAKIDDGAILYNGKRYKAPSPAAIEAVVDCGGPPAARNGWNDWSAFLPNGTKRTLSSMR